MFTRKKKLLFVSEASYSQTGFGRYYHDLISRLHETDKYRIAELGCFGNINNPDDHSIKWRYYANQVSGDDSRYANYTGDPGNKTGKWRFNTVLLDFEPDIVIDLRDPPMFGYQSISPLRKYFHWMVSPPVDSAPQANEFLGLYYSADTVVPYTDYGYQTISSEAPGCNVVPAIYPGIDTEEFRPLSSVRCREKFGLPTDKKIIGTVMRNQVRKLFPNLIRDFKAFLEKSGRDDIVLHLHTTFPDLNPWNLPKHIIESEIYDKIYLTNSCYSCKHVFINKWQDDNLICPNCRKQAAAKNKLNQGPSNAELVEIYNCYDLYVQYANCEGLGYGIIEAGMCGVPTMGVDYSAISNAVELTGGVKLKPLILQRDINTDALRAIPDPSEFISACERFFANSDDEIRLIRERTRSLSTSNFNPNNNAKKWEELIDSVECEDKWCSPQEVVPRIDLNNFQASSFFDLVYSVLEKTVPNDAVLYSYYIDEYIVKTGNLGFVIEGGSSSKPYTAENAVKWIEGYISGKISVESIRTGHNKLNDQDYIDYAEAKEISNLKD